MVVGLDRFKEHFAEYKNRYVLIGGAACDLIMDEAGIPFRATKDLDIILCMEALDRDFAEAFWEFVKQGQYRTRAKTEGSREFYRFSNPAVEGFPLMLELFSRVPDVISIADGSQLTPIPTDEAVSSLSAIVLDDSYYAWVMSGRVELDGVSIVGAEYIVPLKMLAWLNLRASKADGEIIDSRKINKHKKDVFRLSQVIDPDILDNTPDIVKANIKEFINAMSEEGKLDMKALGLRRQSVESVLEIFRHVYKL